MANIDTELSTITTAIYGKDMRTAIHDAIEKVNDESSTTASTVAGLSDSIESVESDISTIEDEIGTLGGDVKCTVYSANFKGSGFGGDCTFEKTGSIVSFEFIFAVSDPPQTGDYFVLPVALPSNFKPKYSGEHDKVFPISPSPVSQAGEHPYLLMHSDVSQNVLEFRVYDARASVIGSLFGGTSFISTGVYTTAEENAT